VGEKIEIPYLRRRHFAQIQQSWTSDTLETLYAIDYGTQKFNIAKKSFKIQINPHGRLSAS
jgi:hypothetical protein